MIAAVGLVMGGLLCIAAAGLLAAPHAAHDLGDAISGQMPAFARVAFLGSLLLAAARCSARACSGSRSRCWRSASSTGGAGSAWCSALAAAAAVAGAFPVAQLAGSTLLAYAADPVLDAALSSTHGLGAADRSLPADRGRKRRIRWPPARSRCRPRAAAGSEKPTRATRSCSRRLRAIPASRTTRPTCASRSGTWSPRSRSTTARSISRSRRWCSSTWRRPTAAPSRSTAWRARSSAPRRSTASRWPS